MATPWDKTPDAFRSWLQLTPDEYNNASPDRQSALRMQWERLQQAPLVPQPLSLKRLVEVQLQQWDRNAPSLPRFEISEGAAFKCYWRGNETGVPALLGNPARPSLLLHDLQNVEHKETGGYKYIDSSQKIGPIALYGTSGAGKTRTIFEYLSHNYGFYLSAGADPLSNPGSEDVPFLIQHCRQEMRPIQLSDHGSKESSDANLLEVQNLLRALLHVRKEVFCQIDTVLRSSRGRGLSCYEWLLLQLFPREVLRCDIFLDVYRQIVKNKLQYFADGASKLGQISCFMDEAQVLLTQLEGVFLSAEGNEARSSYSAFLKGLTNLRLAEGITHFPCFSGTGMSIEAYKAAARSLVVKPDLKKDHSFYFVGLKTMSASDVIQYMSKFLNLDEVKDDLVKHAGDWLKGRPRWVATFIETYVERQQTKSKRELRGNFDRAERPLIKALNCYIEVCTANPKDENRRFSWSLQDKSAFQAVSKMFDKAGREWSEAQETFRRATFEFSFSGRGQLVKKKAADMIEAGIASVHTEIDNGADTEIDYGADFVQAIIWEPLIIQASVTFFGLQDSISKKVASTTSSSEMGNVFEQFLLPSIQTRFQNILRSQVAQDSSLVDFTVPEWSSYGVLAIKCETPSDTIAWINASVNARFEGAVPPFCFPDTLFGPDVAFLMRSHAWVEFRLAALQAKLKFQLNQADALRTVVPELFYHENRGSNPSWSLTGGDLRGLWEKAENKLFGIEQVDITPETRTRISTVQAETGKKRKREIVRVLVQYPAEKTESAEPGPIAENAYKTMKKCKEKGKCNCRLHDHLITIDVSNSVELFGWGGVRLLELVKPKEIPK